MNRAKIYSIEFLRVFLILSVFLVHIGDRIDTGMKQDILKFFGTNSWHLAFATHPFFIIGVFFLYGRLAKGEGTDVFANIGKLWMRLMPGIIFCYAVLLILWARLWWMLPFCFFPSSGYGLSGSGLSYELVGYSDWFVGVYFVTNCLFVALFAMFRRRALFPVCILMFFCWSAQTRIRSDSMLMSDGMYFGFLSPPFALGICCMGLGMVAGYLSARWKPHEGIFLRLLATTVEGLALIMLFNYVYRGTLVHYHLVAMHLITAALLISAAHSWGYISAFLNRFCGVMYASRYTYSLLLIQGMLVHYFRFNHNFEMNAHTCSLIIFVAAVPLILLGYHLVEKWLVAKLKRLLRNDPNAGEGGMYDFPFAFRY